MYLCLNKLASKVWKKNCSNFLYTMYKAGRKSELFCHSVLTVFSFLVMQQISSFLKEVLFFFWKNIYTLLVFFNHVPYVQISDMIPGVNTISRKVNIGSVNRAGGLGVFWGPSRGFKGQSTPRKNLVSKEHLDWLK